MRVEIKDIKDAPNLSLLKAQFGISEEDAIIAYGNAIYAPHQTLSRDLIEHELVHCERQGFDAGTARRWWERYYEDPLFRLEEELLAYRRQYQYCCAVYKDRNKRSAILLALAKELASVRYGTIISTDEALVRIKS